MQMAEHKALFGGDAGWHSKDWTASDDRVRGGKSQSYLTIANNGNTVVFEGELDIKTLGGAGFASQRTTGEDRVWDLSKYDGIVLKLGHADSKRYTFTIKDELLPKNPDNGREQSTISWEFDFQANAEVSGSSSPTFFIPWKALKPTFRGREMHDTKPLDTKKIRRFSIMMRSFFGTQEGHFALTIKSILAVKESAGSSFSHQSDTTATAVDDVNLSATEKGEYGLNAGRSVGPLRRSWWRTITSTLILLLGAAAVPFALYQVFPDAFWFLDH